MLISFSVSFIAFQKITLIRVFFLNSFFFPAKFQTILIFLNFLLLQIQMSFSNPKKK
jgi:hypothetical protein